MFCRRWGFLACQWCKGKSLAPKMLRVCPPGSKTVPILKFLWSARGKVNNLATAFRFAPIIHRLTDIPELAALLSLGAAQTHPFNKLSLILRNSSFRLMVNCDFFMINNAAESAEPSIICWKGQVRNSPDIAGQKWETTFFSSLSVFYSSHQPLLSVSMVAEADW